MNLSVDDVRQLAELSKLKFSKEELNDLYEQIKKIVDFKYMVKLSNLNLEDTPICINPIPIENFMREDVESKYFKLDDVLLNVPESIEEYIAVPRIIE